MAGLQVVSSAPKGSLDGSIYWVGTNGHVYIKGAGGNTAAVRDLGTRDQAQPWNLILNGAVEIADPNPGGGQPSGGGGGGAPSNPNGGGGYAAPPKPDKSNDIALQNAGLAAVDQQEQSGLSSIDAALGTLKGRYAEDSTKAEGQYTENATTNNQNLQKNNQTALVNAAQGRRGLFGQLSAIGALSGSGIDLANRAVQKGANDDLAGATDNFNTNQTMLDKAIGDFRDENKRRIEDADTAAVNARTNVKNQSAQNRLGFYQNLINDYAAMGDSANASKFTGLASSLYPALAKTSVPNANLTYQTAAFTPGTMADYLAGNESTQVAVAPTQPGQTLPGLVATSPTVKKKQLQTV